MIILLRLLALLALLALPAAAAAESLVICHVGGPGSTAQAQPVLDKFLRHMEKTGGLTAGSMKGEYHTAASGCLEYIKKEKPLLGVFDLATYLQHHGEWKLRPLAHMGQADSLRYHVLVRDGTYKDLKDLKGKSLVSTVENLRFVSRIIFAGKVDAAKEFKVKTTARPLKGIRNVARSKDEATLVDALAHDHLDELKLQVKLRSIYSSPGLPGLTLAVLQIHNADAKTRKVVARVTQALPKMCTGEGQKMCKTFQVTVFAQARAAVYRALEKAYGK